jgi:hypothetical protein
VSAFPTLLFIGPDGELIRPAATDGHTADAKDYNFGKFRESEQIMTDILNNPAKYDPGHKAGQEGGGCGLPLLPPQQQQQQQQQQQGGSLYGLMYGLAYGQKKRGPLKKGKSKKARSKRATKRRALRRRRTVRRR